MNASIALKGVEVKIILATCCAIVTFTSFAFAAGASKSEVLNHLVKTQARTSEKMTIIEQKITQTLNSTLNIEPTSVRIHAFEQTLEQLLSQKRELAFEQRFYDQLIFRIEKDYSGANLREFLVQALLVMAQNETSNATQEVNLTFVKHLTYLAIALRTLPEPNENLLSFLESYTEFSTIQQPKTPIDFVNQRNYTNGILTEMASPVPREEAGSPTVGLAPEKNSTEPSPLVSEASKPTSSKDLGVKFKDQPEGFEQDVKEEQRENSPD